MSLCVSIILAVLLVPQLQTVQPPAAQTLPALAPAQPPAPVPRLDPAKGDQNSRYTLGPQDQLKITVFDEPDLSNIYRIDSDGFITFPMINKVAASGITPGELQDRIRTMLASGFLNHPQVRVEVEVYMSQSIIVSV